jgi:hypothetical protein
VSVRTGVRVTRPRRGTGGVAEDAAHGPILTKPENTFTLEQARSLARQLHGPKFDDPERIEQLWRRLRLVCSALTGRLHEAATSEDVKDQRAHLERIVSLAGALLDRIEFAGAGTRATLAHSYPPLRVEEAPIVDGELGAFDIAIATGVPGVEGEARKHAVLSRDRRALERIKQGAEAAMRKLPRAGRKTLVATAALRELKRIYEEESGEPFTLTYNKGDHTPEAFMSDGSYFVARAARMVWPEITNSQLATAMRSFVRRSNRRNQPA